MEGIVRLVTLLSLRYRFLPQYSGLAVLLPKVILHHAARSVVLTLVRPVHPAKAEVPIAVTEVGIVTAVSPVRPLHRKAGIFVTVLPKVKVLILVKPLNGCTLEVKSAQDAAFQFTVASAEQLAKALVPIEVTELGIVVVVRPVRE